jgi:hypothetical protein
MILQSSFQWYKLQAIKLCHRHHKWAKQPLELNQAYQQATNEKFVHHDREK